MESPLAALKDDAQAAKRIAAARKAEDEKREAALKRIAARKKFDTAFENTVAFNAWRSQPDRWAEWPAILIRLVDAIRGLGGEALLLGWCNRLLKSVAPESEPWREPFAMGERRGSAAMLLAIERNKKNAKKTDREIIEVFRGSDEYGCFDATAAAIQFIADKVHIGQTVEMWEAEQVEKQRQEAERLERNRQTAQPSATIESPAMVDQRPKQRPCYDRDHEWLRQYEAEGSPTFHSHAKIRDLWKVETGERVTREVVIEGIKKAESERKNGMG